jgi:protocatechuate 4,5-dioxygenase beta chain
MAEVIGGLGCSHAPSIAHAWDEHRSDEPGWRPLFAGLDRAREWLNELNPDALVVVYNDHFNEFFLDVMPTFTLGIGDAFPISDEGRESARDLPPVPGHHALGEHLASVIIDAGFDLTVCRDQPVDHGVLAPLPVVNRDWAFPIVPVALNVVAPPLPTPRRCWQLGEAIGSAIAAFPVDLRVVVLGTGGLSHQLQGPRFGEVSAEWDREFLRLMLDDPAKTAELSMDELAERGGAQAVEVVQWIAMRGALPIHCDAPFQFYYPWQLMGYAVAAYLPRARNAPS